MRDLYYAAVLAFELSDVEVERLGAGEALVRDELLGGELARALCAELTSCDPALAPAAMGAAGARWSDAQERGDEIAWLARERAGPALAALWHRFESIGAALRRGCYLDVRGFEVQLARYRGVGAKYAPHRDAFTHGGLRAPPGSPGRRVVTAIYYVNPEWRREHGGQLRIHGAEETDIAPVLDRLVLFLSERVVHEVRACAAERRAITAWFRGAD